MNMQAQDDEIDLGELASFLWKKKLIIFAVTFIGSVVAIIYSLAVTPEYQVSVVVKEVNQETNRGSLGGIGGAAALLGVDIGGSSSSKLPYLEARILAEEFIIENNLQDVLLGNKDTDQSINENQMLYRAVTAFFDDVLTVNTEVQTGLTTIGVRWTDAEVALVWSDLFIDMANRNLRAIDLALAEERYEYLNAQLQATSSVELRQSIATMIEGQLQTMMLANSSSEYAFTIVDPPRIPDTRAYPRRSLMVILAFLASFFSACLFLLIRRSFSLEKG